MWAMPVESEGGVRKVTPKTLLASWPLITDMSRAPVG